MKTPSILVLVAALTLTGCAGYSRVRQYPAHLPGNVSEEFVGGKRFLIKRHPFDNTILIQPTIARAAVAGFASGLTLGIVSTSAVGPAWTDYKAAAEQYAAARGCTVESTHQLESVSYEAQLKCPAK